MFYYRFCYRLVLGEILTTRRRIDRESLDRHTLEVRRLLLFDRVTQATRIE